MYPCLHSSVLNHLFSYYEDENPEENLRDPVAAYKLLCRLREELIYIIETIQSIIDVSQCDEFQDELKTTLIPQYEDLDGAASGLIRLQEIYKLYPEDITKETSLDADEAFHVGRVAYKEYKFQHAFLWFSYSGIRWTENSSTNEKDLLHYLSLSAKHFGSLPWAIYYSQELLYLNPYDNEVKLQLNRLLHFQKSPNPNIFRLDSLSSNYEALCRGEVDERTSKRQRALSCRYSTSGGNPRLMYAPVKEEELWDEPKIIRFHDVISDTEIETLKDIARPQLSRSGVYQDGQGKISKHRVSQSVFLDDDDPVDAHVSQRIEDVTGLSMEKAEPLLVQNYGIGGRFEPHIDALGEENDRIATFLIYMSDVEEGGATVFIKVGIAVKPEKGSAVFWYNLQKNGESDFNTKHAGCPVLQGNKWVANKWIAEFGQVFRRPCSLHKSE
nr:prolyl 4-hydroxylase subunit alpha-1-like [Danio rerio]|eukprot:XP_021326960.1 prolyl 4-hydroxylase subunit alpha-1-like [Danio rerio]